MAFGDRKFWTSQFIADLGKGKVQYLSLYLSLRENGDNHSTAKETVMAEYQLAQVMR